MKEKHDKSGLAGSGSSNRPSQTHLILGRSPEKAEKHQAKPAKSSTIDPKWRQSYEELLQTRDYILDRALSMKEQGAETQPKDRQQANAESATTVNHRDFSFAQASAYNELLGEINHALRRIEEGRYGICEITGKPIPMSRLKAIPWTRFVAEAERKLEKHGRSPVHFEFPPAEGLKGGRFSEQPLSTEPESEETEAGEG
jgi:DnaK suppressor protein